ncbi:NAD(P)-dependent alcohol dehydrogenase [Reinekea blandensis]|uniref:Putative zinc-binding oxidoreductase n=1 Tax=Reinekea blandensis MED297 TaxID=314283 RepID=A4BI56_9GAMM|nr:NAD(P)-dependent alcohol dehydrogenase [Reinekea blandensis]EAR08199.1 putative zinc-binding oxidoreductase [Reinekea sp. MED297] [Reinekea blandensis MED297]
MKAAIYSRYGTEDQLDVQDVATPEPKPNEVLLKVHAVSINGSDCEFLSGTPAYARINGLLKPRKHILGSDICGVIAAIGSQVTDFQEGDAVFCDNFDRLGGFAEYVCVPASKLVRKPSGLTDEQVAAIPQSGVIAMQSLTTKSPVSAGQSVLINGAAGGVGSFAVQMALVSGAHVVAIDHGKKLNYLRQLGVEEVYDYQALDRQVLTGRFDKIVDLVGGQSVLSIRRMLKPDGHSLVVGGPVRYLISTLVVGTTLSIGRPLSQGILAHQQNENDMLEVARLAETEQIQVPVSAVYALEDIRQAFKALRTQAIGGKVVIKPGGSVKAEERSS